MMRVLRDVALATFARLGRRARGERTGRARRFRPGQAGPDLEVRQLLSLAALAEPTAEEQYMLALVNRARANPAAEAQRLLDLSHSDPTLQAATRDWDLDAFARTLSSMPPQPPLAFNTRLIAAARAQSRAMLDANAQFHSPGGYLTDANVARASDGQAYYPVTQPGWATGENVFAYSGNVDSDNLKDYVDFLHAGLMIDWGVPSFSHLHNIMNPGPAQGLAARKLPYSEIGIGLLTDAHPGAPPTANPQDPSNRGLSVGPVIATQEFGWRNRDAFLTGTVYLDRDGDSFYTPGEGLGGVTIFAAGLDGQGTFSTQTWGSGGYSLKLPPGDYSISAFQGVPYLQSVGRIHMGSDNVGWDLSYTPRAPADMPIPGDYDGDGKTDLAVFRTDTAEWLLFRSRDGGFRTQFGWGGVDQAVPADYDGDGITDLAVFRPSTAEWLILRSKDGAYTVQFGMAGHDVPAPADYDGDGRADLAVFRPQTAEWLILRSRDGGLRTQFGRPDGDVPVPGDYDGDGKADLAVYRPGTSEWLIDQSSRGRLQTQFGQGNLDLPVPADYDGDGKLDLATYRPTTSEWNILQSGRGTTRTESFGPGGYPDVFPLDGDYDGDGRADLTLYRTRDALWMQQRSRSGLAITQFGRPGPGRPASSLREAVLSNTVNQHQRVAAPVPASRPAQGSLPSRHPRPFAARRLRAAGGG